MPTTRLQAAADRRSAAARTDLAEALRHLCDDAGVTHRALADAAGLAPSYVGRILTGDAKPSHEAYARLGAVLGTDFTARYYPNTGVAIRDRHQAQMLEALLEALHPRWRAFTEIAVRRPSRGWIDAALHDARASLLVATEIQSALRRLEQLVRWSEEKSASLPSWDGWAALGTEPAVSRLLLVRRTAATRAVAREFGRQLRIAYPAHPDDALSALTGTTAWPGPSLVWASLEGDRARLIPWR